jgi:GNAT superfamily N-acetyltransferase
MNDYYFTVETKPKPEDVRMISDRLAAHQRALFGETTQTELGIFIREDGNLFGGIHGVISGGWLFIGAFWLDERLRGQDYGTHMLAMMEQAALERGITRVYLDTATFQARPFYEKLGYTVYGTIDNIVGGYQMFLMEKRDLDRHRRESPMVLRHELKAESPPFAEDFERLLHSLDAYNKSFQGEFRRAELSIFLRDTQGQIVGGLNGRFLGHWFFNEELWVDEKLRGQGFGKQLLLKAEQEATSRSATLARVYLVGDPLLPFFQRIGYKAITTHRDCPAGYNTYNLIKSL